MPKNTIMKIIKQYFFNQSLLITLLLVGSLSFSSCSQHRYKRMIKKRRSHTKKRKKHKGSYQKKLRKNTTKTKSTYNMKHKRNYRKKSWYNQ
jgi:predicted membrane protein